MNELMLFGTLSAQRTEAALLRGNAVTERFGLTLTPEQCGRLLERRALALRETERIEPGEGILPKLAVALYDSPCVGPENWEEALGGLTELFYHFKGRVRRTSRRRRAARRAGAAIQRLGRRLRGPHRRSRWPRDAALCAHGKGGGR